MLQFFLYSQGLGSAVDLTPNITVFVPYNQAIVLLLRCNWRHVL